MDVESLLAKMVSFDTVNGRLSGRTGPEAALASYLESLAAGRGFDLTYLPVESEANELLISFERDPRMPWILFDSHLDTVSVQGMSIDPFEGTISGGRLSGRGACDTKGSGAAMFIALSRYAEQADGSNNIMLLFSVEEEQEMSGIRAFAKKHLPALGRFVKAAIVGEPTGLRPVVAHCGVQRYLITTHGISVHSSDPSLGHSAISDMSELIHHLEIDYIPTLNASHPLTGTAQFSINVISGGSAPNVIPNECQIQIDRRVAPGETSDSTIGHLDRDLRAYGVAHPEIVYEFESLLETPPLDQSFDMEVLAEIGNSLRDRGKSEEPVGVRFATHAGDLSVAGIPSVVLGPGNIEQAHTKDEWIDLKELSAAVEIYLQIMAHG